MCWQTRVGTASEGLESTDDIRLKFGGEQWEECHNRALVITFCGQALLPARRRGYSSHHGWLTQASLAHSVLRWRSQSLQLLTYLKIVMKI